MENDNSPSPCIACPLDKECRKKCPKWKAWFSPMWQQAVAPFREIMKAKEEEQG